MDVFEILCLALYLLSTPVAAAAVFLFGQDKEICAVANMYGFSIGYCLLYVYPLLMPCFTTEKGFKARLHKCTMNWIIWLSVFTEVCFQIPHNMFVEALHELRGTVLEWPFFAYGFSDGRWNNYHGGEGLADEVWLINVNDGGLGVLLAIVLAYQVVTKGLKKPSLLLILLTVFRDATLFRETVEYMWDHHRKNYPHTTSDVVLRPHAIACLWLVNVMWLIAPILTVVWAWQQLKGDNQRQAKKND